MRTIFPYNNEDIYYYIEVESGDRFDTLIYEYSDIDLVRNIILYNKVTGSYSLEVGDIIKIKKEDFNIK